MKKIEYRNTDLVFFTYNFLSGKTLGGTKGGVFFNNYTWTRTNVTEYFDLPVKRSFHQP